MVLMELKTVAGTLTQRKSNVTNLRGKRRALHQILSSLPQSRTDEDTAIMDTNHYLKKGHLHIFPSNLDKLC